MVVYHSAVLTDEVARKLVDAAQELLEEARLDDLTIRAVAERAGVSTLNVYTRFGGKDGLLDVLVHEGFEELRTRLEACQQERFVDFARAVFREYWEFALESKARYELMFQGTNRSFDPSPNTKLVSQQALANVVRRVGEAIAAGETSLDPTADPARIAAAFWGLIHGTVQFEVLEVGNAVVDWAVVRSEAVEALLRQYVPDA